jgi:Domain of unknown function (DUF4331)
MKRGVLLLTLGAAVAVAVVAAALVGAVGPKGAAASSHREAPLIGDDPAADNTDVYAFVSPDNSDTVTIIANYIPFEDPAGGPNYYSFDPTVLYELNIDNTGDAEEDVVYQFRFTKTIANPNTFLYNTGQLTSATDSDLSIRQTYSVTRVLLEDGDVVSSSVLRSGLPVPPPNIGPRSNPSYDPQMGVASLGADRKVFAGPRDDPFFVDLGSIFDLAGLRQFNTLHALALANEPGKDGVKNYNTHSIALQVPKTDLLRPALADGTIGIYASASRPKITIRRDDGSVDANGKWVQVSRLGNPLVNEVVIPLGKKDRWNASDPSDDAQFLQHYTSPELALRANALYAALNGEFLTGRQDLVAVLLTGVPGLNLTGAKQADLLRLNTAIPPAANPNRLGVLAGDFAGFPNGRRLADDVTDIELRAVICGYGDILQAALGLCNFSPNNVIDDDVDTNEQAFLGQFPYVASPNQGYAHTGHN